MKDRLLTLKAEIREIESLLDTLSGAMREHASEELKNLRFEMDMLNRNMQRTSDLKAPFDKQVKGELNH